MMKLHRSLAVLFAMLLATAPLTHAQDAAPAFEPYEAWYVMNMGGQKAGYTHVTLEKVGDTIVSSSKMRISIKRGDAEMVIEQSSKFVETLEHQPVYAESAMALGAMATQTRLEFGADKWTMTTTVGEARNALDIDPPKDAWLTPGAMSLQLEQAIARGDKEITVKTLDPSLGTQPFTITMKRGESDNIEVFGKVVPATKWTLSMSAMPGVEIEQWTDAKGEAVRELVALLPGMEMEMLLADKELALAEFDAPEMLAASLITPDKRIKDPRHLKRGVFDLVSPGLKETIGESIVTAGHQRAKWIDADTLRIEIDLDKPVTSDNLRKQDKGNYLRATTMLNYKDEVIQQLIAKPNQKLLDQRNAIGPKLIYEVAQDTREFVRNHIDSKDLSVGYASASEVARTGQGDCTEHACLLAAMIRGMGLPARTVTGLVYADQFAGHEGVFGFHMWTQVYLRNEDGTHRWVDLDAAAPGQIQAFDATHIALSTSAMKDSDTVNDMVAMLPLMKGLTIKVVELEWAE